MSEEYVIGKKAVESMAERLKNLSQSGRTSLGLLLFQTANAIRNRVYKSIQTGSRSGRIYDWMADLPGKKGEGPVFLMFGGWDPTEYKAKKKEGYTVMIRMPDNSGGHWIPVKLRTTGSHQASAPGEPPKTDTGQLVAHLHMIPDSAEEMASSLQAEMGTLDLLYPDFLEKGTKFMKPRPWMKPAIDAEEPLFEERLKTLVEDMIR